MTMDTKCISLIEAVCVVLCDNISTVGSESDSAHFLWELSCQVV